LPLRCSGSAPTRRGRTTPSSCRWEHGFADASVDDAHVFQRGPTRVLTLPADAITLDRAVPPARRPGAAVIRLAG
jgi:hypothetical protein